MWRASEGSLAAVTSPVDELFAGFFVVDDEFLEVVLPGLVLPVLFVETLVVVVPAGLDDVDLLAPLPERKTNATTTMAMTTSAMPP